MKKLSTHFSLIAGVGEEEWGGGDKRWLNKCNLGEIIEIS